MIAQETDGEIIPMMKNGLETVGGMSVYDAEELEKDVCLVQVLEPCKFL